MKRTQSIDRVVVIHDRIRVKGGASALARQSVFGYRKLGLKVTYLNGEGKDDALTAAGITCVGLGQKPLLETSKLTAFRKGIHNGEAAAFIDDWISKNDTPGTVYHLHNWSQILSPSVFKPLSKVAERTVVSCHDFFNVCPNGGLFNYPEAQVCEKRAMSPACWASQCDKSGMVNKYWRMLRHQHLNNLAGFTESAMTFVALHDGMLETMFEAGFSAPNATAIRNPAVAYTDHQVDVGRNKDFLFVGRMSPEKGFALALDAAQRAMQPIIVAGTGDDMDALAKKYTFADFRGFCDRAELAELASTARAIIVPSPLNEPFGLVIAEAARSGIPIVLSETCSLASEVTSLGAGRSFDPTDVQQLADILSELADDDHQVEAMGNAAFAAGDKISSTPEAWSQAFVSLFESLLMTTENKTEASAA